MDAHLSRTLLKLGGIGREVILARGILARAWNFMRKAGNVRSLIKLVIGRKLLHFSEQNPVLDHVVRFHISVTFHKFSVEAALALHLVVEARTWTILILTELI